MAQWLDVRDEGQYQKALALARGTYQKSLLAGYECWSGRNLIGRARTLYGQSYRTSRQHLLERFTEAGISWRMEWRKKRLVCILGEEPLRLRIRRAALERIVADDDFFGV